MTDYDYVVVGGGTAGCVLAARLSQDPAARVLLLEAGGAAPDGAGSDPAGWPQLLGSDADWAVAPFDDVLQRLLGNQLLLLYHLIEAAR